MYAGAEAVLLNYPSTGKRGRWDRRSDEDVKKDAEKAAKKLDDIWDKAVMYAKMDSTARADKKNMDSYNPQMDALLPVVRGQAKLFVEVNVKSDIESAIEWVKKRNIKAVFTGMAEGWRVADKLAAAGIEVITGPVLSIPGRENDKYDAAYTNAAKMQKAGVKVALRTNDAENVRNLPFNAGFAATYGMGVEEALKAITIVPAQIFGVADKYGSLEKGKVANLFIADGDPFEMKTRISHLFIRGWNVPLESRHTLLYDEFLERSPGLK
jgi:imidazolonepropionase-like amidohydrolase